MNDNQKTEWKKYCDEIAYAEEKFKAKERKIKKWPFEVSVGTLLVFLIGVYFVETGKELLAIWLVLWVIAFELLKKK